MNYYTILGITKNCDLYEIKKAYRKLALQYHPDKINDLSKKKIYEEKFKQISEAYQILSNPMSRKQYDLLGNSFINQNIQFISPKDLFIYLFPDIDKNTLSIIDHLLGDLSMHKSFSQIVQNFPYEKITKNQIHSVMSYIKKITKSWFQNKKQKNEEDTTTDIKLETTIQKQQVNPITIIIEATLEEIYQKKNKLVFIPIIKQCFQCTKKINKNCLLCLGKIFYCKTTTLSVPVYKQSKLIYSNEGHKIDFYKQGNIIITIKPLKHSIYKKKSKYDLFTSIKVNPLEICRKEYIYLPLLSNKQLKIQLTHDCFQYSMKKLCNYGLYNDIDQKYGDLYIHFIVTIPPISNTLLTKLSNIIPNTCKYKNPTNIEIEQLQEKIMNVPILYNDRK